MVANDLTAAMQSCVAKKFAPIEFSEEIGLRVRFDF